MATDKPDPKSMLTREELLEIAAEVLRGERDPSDLELYGLKLGPLRSGRWVKVKALSETGSFDDPDVAEYVRAHKHSYRNRHEIEMSEVCNCFHCMHRFGLASITAWRDDNQTAVCPRCGVDAVIGSKSGFVLSDEMLNQMHDYWFGRMNELANEYYRPGTSEYPYTESRDTPADQARPRGDQKDKQKKDEK